MKTISKKFVDINTKVIIRWLPSIYYTVSKHRRDEDKNTLLYRALTTHLETTYYVSGWNTQLIRDAQSRLDTGTRVVLNAIFSEPRRIVQFISAIYRRRQCRGNWKTFTANSRLLLIMRINLTRGDRAAPRMHVDGVFFPRWHFTRLRYLIKLCRVWFNSA